MKTKHVLDQLSAYMDGKARRPDLIARHLRQCAACSRRHMELSKMSAHLRALPAPEVQPGFVTRVMAVTRTAKLVKRWPRWVFGGVAWALAGLAVAALALVVWAPWSSQPVVTQPPQVAADVQSQSVDESALLQQIAECVAQGERTPILDLDDSDVEMDRRALADAAGGIEQLAFQPQSSGENTYEYEYPGPSLDTALEKLNDSEARVFSELLREYARKG